MPRDKFQNKYRIPSARKPDWDYRNHAIYFVTLCTQKRLFYFGNVENGKMILSETGEIAFKHWFEIPNHFPFIELINFVVMPNHIHGLLEIHDINDNIWDDTSKSVNTTQSVDTSHGVVTPQSLETLHATSLQVFGQNSKISEPPDINVSMAEKSPKRGSLSSVLRSYKSSVTKSVHENGFKFGWQPRFHDHIVSGPDEFRRIYDYISNNPKNWKD
jgi:REP element-mobilizing transposase RayT